MLAGLRAAMTRASLPVVNLNGLCKTCQNRRNVAVCRLVAVLTAYVATQGLVGQNSRDVRLRVRRVTTDAPPQRDSDPREEGGLRTRRRRSATVARLKFCPNCTHVFGFENFPPNARGGDLLGTRVEPEFHGERERERRRRERRR